MSNYVLSSSWYRVEDLKPQLRPHAHIHRQRFRGKAWYVLQDRASSRTYRFTPETYLIMSLMDGKSTVKQIWERVAKDLGEDVPTQDEVIQLLSQLHSADMLQSDVLPDLNELTHRGRKQNKSWFAKTVANPLAIKIPMWDPDQFLNRTFPYVRFLFNVWGLLVWLIVVGVALILGLQHAQELTENLSDRILSSSNLLVLWLVFPIVKLFHELGHAYAAKAGGGEVHEVGLMFMVLSPVPYVDASASAAFRSSKFRALVGASGMLVELFLAALALFIWLVVEPCVVRAVAFDVIFIASLSTLVFNANPLLKYDGYYILSDLLEIPNLASQANKFWGYLVNRYLFGRHELEPSVHTTGEKLWLCFYAPVSFLYRMLVAFAIVIFVAEELFFIGVIYAIWSFINMIVMPIIRMFRFVQFSPQLHRHRRRALQVVYGSLGTVLIFLFYVPVPLYTHTQGVIWVPENAEVRAGASGFMHPPLVEPGEWVEEGEVLLEAEDKALKAQIKSQSARVEQREIEFFSKLQEDRLQAAIASEELAKEKAALLRLRQNEDELIVKAKLPGRFILPNAVDLDGKFVKKGEMLGYVLSHQPNVIRVVVGQNDIDLVRNNTSRIEMKIIDRLDHTFKTSVLRIIPGGMDQLPTKALALEGGGIYATDPSDSDGIKTLEHLFQFDLAVPEEAGPVTLGARVYIRFIHQSEPLVYRGYRQLRRLFLSHFNV